MADFYQTGAVATMHRLGEFKLEKIEKQLEAFSKVRPIALVLPCLYTELEGPALGPIIEELKQIRYLKQIVVSLDRANYNQFQHAQQFFGVLDGIGATRVKCGRRFGSALHGSEFGISLRPPQDGPLS